VNSPSPVQDVARKEFSLRETYLRDDRIVPEFLSDNLSLLLMIF
jgi:hypothetical protein